MIVNKQILIDCGCCEEAIKHFFEIVSNNDETFEMSLDDATRYLENLEKNNPELYSGWHKWILDLSVDVGYIKSTSVYELGKYIVGLDKQTKYETLDEAKTNRDTILLEMRQQKIKEVESVFVVNHLTYNDDGSELWKVVDVETTNETENFQVFNPITGVYVTELTLEDAKKELYNMKKIYGEYCYPRLLIFQEIYKPDGKIVYDEIEE